MTKNQSHAQWLREYAHFLESNTFGRVGDPVAARLRVIAGLLPPPDEPKADPDEFDHVTTYGCVGGDGDFDAGMEPGMGDYVHWDDYKKLLTAYRAYRSVTQKSEVKRTFESPFGAMDLPCDNCGRPVDEHAGLGMPCPAPRTGAEP